MGADTKPEEPKKTMDTVEAAEQKAPVTPLMLDLAKKGQPHKIVKFAYKELGFEFKDFKDQSKTKCVRFAPFGRSAKCLVKVSKVEADQQAAASGVELDEIIYKVNDKEIADAAQLRDLIAKHWLPEEAKCD